MSLLIQLEQILSTVRSPGCGLSLPAIARAKQPEVSHISRPSSWNWQRSGMARPREAIWETKVELIMNGVGKSVRYWQSKLCFLPGQEIRLWSRKKGGKLLIYDSFAGVHQPSHLSEVESCRSDFPKQNYCVALYKLVETPIHQQRLSSIQQERDTGPPGKKDRPVDLRHAMNFNLTMSSNDF